MAAGQVAVGDIGGLIPSIKWFVDAGKVPSWIRDWREGNGGTQAVMASVLIKKDGTKDDVQTAVDAALKGT
ncbi:uncharacterized protein BDV14DRAFT_203618 [Aspergillus stella-maris]|uniref:uncharacterized protein n=1 Tax=Aspergillus stella-maris TaxID=1810926 RepID=UPI003CCDB2BC